MPKGLLNWQVFAILAVHSKSKYGAERGDLNAEKAWADIGLVLGGYCC